MRRKGGEPVDPGTVFQIGSTTKAFLATTMAIAVDRGGLAWDDRVVDLDPDFQMKDPWVTREFRVFDMIAQRSGLPPYANDFVGLLGFDQPAMIRSLRHVEPVSSFRSTFAYTNITHMLAQRVVAQAMGAEDWDDVVRAEIFEPLGMTNSSFTADAIEAAADTTSGYLWTREGHRRGSVHADLSLWLRRRRLDQLHRRGHVEMGAPAPGGRRLRGSSASSRTRTSPSPRSPGSG